MIFSKQDTIKTDLGGRLDQEYTLRRYYLMGETSNYELDGDTTVVVGGDYATVVCCQTQEQVDEILGKITLDDYRTLVNEYEVDCIPVLEINGVFIIIMEVDHFDDELNEFIDERAILFGASMDDVSMLDCFPFIDFWQEGVFPVFVDNIPIFTDINENYQNSVYDEDGNIFSDDEDKAELLEMTVDAVLRIYEYNDDPRGERMMHILQMLKPALENLD